MANSVLMSPILITSSIQALMILNVFGGDATTEIGQNPKSFQRPGDFVVGGLFDIHFYSADGKDGLINPLSLQWMYAMVFAIEKMNNRTNLLPNVTLGFDIHDTHADANIAVLNSLDFITTNSECESSVSNPEENSVIAVIGPRTNNAAVDTANFFNLFKVPQVSYAATTNLLSDSQYEYFLRTVPSVEAQVDALLNVIAYHNWTTVVLLYTDDFAFGRSTRQIFTEQSAKMNICIALTRQFRIDSTSSELSDIGKNIREFKNIQVIVAIAEESPMLELLSQFLIDGLLGYVWLGTDSWTVSTQLVSPAFFPIVKGMLGIVSHSDRDEGFHDYLHRRRVQTTPNGGVEDPFLAEYWEKQLNCTFADISDPNGISRCDNRELSPTDPLFDDVPVGSVFDAVETIARGLHSVLNCTSSTCNNQYSVAKSHLLLKAMNKSTFNGHSGNLVTFTATGDIASPAWYDIKNLVPLENFTLNTNGKWTTVSAWKNWTLADFSVIRWPTSDDLTTTVKPPPSFCSDACSPGERLTNLDTNICCWNCTKCGENSYSDVENSNVCLPCGKNQSSNTNRTRCDDFRKVFLELTSFSGTVIAVSGIAGLLISLVIFITLVLKKVHGSFSRYGEAIFVVCLASFSTSFLCFVRPTILSCRFVAVVQPMPVTILSTLLMIVSYSMYNSKKSLVGKTILWLGATLTIQLVTVTIWITTGGPEPHESMVRSEGSAYVSCESSGELPGYFMILIYQVVLDLLGAVFSFSLRMNKNNFYEGKFIFSTFVVHSMVWIAVSLMYLLLPSERHARPVLLSQCLTVSGYIYIGSLFVPKLYALKYKPYMLRKRSMSRERQQWKFKRKHPAAKKSSNRRKIYLRGCKRTIRTLKDETDFINNGIKLITESFTSGYEQQIFKHLETFGNLHDLKINIIINSSNLTGTQL